MTKAELLRALAVHPGNTVFICGHADGRGEDCLIEIDFELGEGSTEANIVLIPTGHDDDPMAHNLVTREGILALDDLPTEDEIAAAVAEGRAKNG